MILTILGNVDPDRVVMDDLIMLGNAVPDEISDNRRTVCTACYSPKHGLVRIYPVPPEAKMPRWNVVSMPLEKNPQDTRTESWKVQGSKDEWSRLREKIQVVDKLTRPKQIDLLKKLYDEFGVNCVQDLNDAKRSLGIIKPKIIKSWMADRKNYSPSVQSTLDSDVLFLTIHNYQKQPRVQYHCSGCRSAKPHDQQILEWGIYEWMRKNPANMEQGLTNLGITDPNFDKYFLVGNAAQHRNSFMVISVFRFKRSV